MTIESTKNCLIVTYGPVPTPQYQTVEGGGMRAWGLAKGLSENGTDVVVAVNESFPQELQSHEGIRLVNWSLDDQFTALINSFDAVIISYCMGDPSVFVANNINDDIQLILDVYVPIYVEVSARNAEDITTEYGNYMQDVRRFNHVLKRGDYFLCANEAQKTFYTGVLSALSIVNPRSYRDERILVAPFGIHDTPAVAKQNPYKNLGIKDSDFVVLWFGGLYPWFRVEELLQAIFSLSKHRRIKFVFVGGKNPFNSNPDFTKQYDKTVTFTESHELINRTVYFVDWVDFDDRINWYKHADIVISLNQPGEENRYSWRTRVMDYVWGEMAIVTNGGDPLSEELIREHAALRLPDLSSKSIAKTIEELSTSPGTVDETKNTLKALKPLYYWKNIMKPVQELVSTGETPYNDEGVFKKKNGFHAHSDTSPTHNQPQQGSKLRKLARAPVRILTHVRKKGVYRSVKVGANIIRTQSKRHTVQRQKKFVFISHPMDNTGAPLVLLQIIREYVEKYGPRRIQLVTPHMEPNIEREVRQLGIQVDKAVLGIGFRFLRLQLGLRKDDFVLMNTVAIYDNYREFVLLWLKTGRLQHADWFIHEDKAQLPVINKEFLSDRVLGKVKPLVEEKKLSIFVPSERTKKDYDKILETSLVKTIPLHVELDSKYKFQRKALDYQHINFLISGTPSDGRKGQLLALMAFYEFMKTYYEKNPRLYRKFTLNLISIGDDYMSQQIKWICKSALKGLVKIYPQVPRSEALAITSKCNAVICCSLNETFGLYVAEGMFMGHLVLRNNSAGVDEQLKDGVNGFKIDHTDIKQFAAAIEKVLNKKTSSDARLQKMGQRSQGIVESFLENSYIDQL